MNFIKILKSKNACIPGAEYCEGKELKEAWDNCDRGDWMLWAASNCVDLKTLTKAKTRCARLVIHLMKDHRSINALDAADRFSNGELSISELREAVSSAYAAVADAHFDSATYSASTAAAYAADPHFDSATAAAATYAAADDDAYFDSAAEKDTLKKCADICRGTIPFEMIEKYYG